ncbi:DUF221-domain-containing protein [Aulographum hederae CBS 113979]|uniref:DUF221-domain-containing protein n=1 Tax=Aulographum hederae CBS 113979 TaxID=1176131 RepID=A0A6G1H5L4_9PEZI|nr:DUF221-domain-containing protein [Aulographum hederae CBS 113979]
MPLAPRQSSDSNVGDQFLDLIADPFQTEIQANSIYAALIWSFAVSGGLFLFFCLLRPRSSAVYAPRQRHADEKHAPQPLSKGFFAWFTTVRRVQEPELVSKIGLDAVVFLRFLRMIRDIMLVFTVIGCAVLIPVNLVGGHDVYDQWSDVATLMKFTPQYIFGQKFWAFVVMAYVFQGVICGFVWWNYTAVLKLRRAYFESPDYRASLHSRTLLLTHVREPLRSDSGLSQIAEEAKPTDDAPRTAIARNVKDLPELIEAHDETVQTLEGYLAKYFADPNKLPDTRPTCKPFKEDRKNHKNKKVDAIEYLTGRMKRLATQIKEVRETLDKRNPMPYGFVSYTHIEDAHSVAHATRKKAPQGSTISLAPKSNDLIWVNLPMSKALRRTRRFWDTLWMVLLTILFIPLNILSAVFLSDFSHLGLIWDGFRENLATHPVGWGIAQGILAPAFQALIFMALPVVFRKLYHHSGDISKTSRERHVTSRLYAFFVVNNLVVFSIFGSAFRFVAAVIRSQDQGTWDAIQDAHLFTNVMNGLCNVSTFWLTYQMQQNLGAATDIAQLLPLVWGSFRRRFTHPTPRQLIELSAPQPFDYSAYYNTYLFVATVGFCFGTLQPIVLPVTAFYLAIELWFKRYLLQYVLITKTESGGQFWRMLINRLLFAVLLMNAVIALVVGAQGVGARQYIGDVARSGAMLYAMIPLPFLLWAFKWYCSKCFDDKLRYYSTNSTSAGIDVEGASNEGGMKKGKKNDRVGVRFGHPALYRRLMTPMVHAKSQHLMAEIYDGSADDPGYDHPAAARATGTTTPRSVYGYSDTYMSDMDHSTPGKPAKSQQPEHGADFEFVKESDLDFENFKRRAEFREEFGGDGELYGKPEDLISRPGTPSTFATMNFGIGMGSLPEDEEVEPSNGNGTRTSSLTLAKIGDGEEGEGTTYGPGYSKAGSSESPSPSGVLSGRRHKRHGSVDVDVPTAGLDAGDIVAAGKKAYRDHEQEETGSLSGGRLLSLSGGIGRSSEAEDKETDDERGSLDAGRMLR